MRRRIVESKAVAAGLLVAAMVVAGVFAGSGGFQRLDPAVFGYAVASVLAAFAVAYRFTLWAQRPPSRMYFKRGRQLLLSPRSRSHKVRLAAGATLEQGQPLAVPGAGTLGAALAKNFIAQNFIRRRGVYRWVMHLCLSGGCTLAFAITFPLVFGWVHFESFLNDATMYRAKVFGFAVDSFSVHSFKAFAVFNFLNFAALLVMMGLVMAGWRRLTDAGERATQTFAEDWLPLLLIFAVTITGLMLTVSYKFMGGRGHGFVAVVHMMSVIALLFYIPFGKLFHMFQRTCSLCVSLYKRAGASGPRASCRACGCDYASQMHVADLVSVLDELGFDYRFATPRGEVHYQEICPACRRRMLALHQGKTVGR